MLEIESNDELITLKNDLEEAIELMQTLSTVKSDLKSDVSNESSTTKKENDFIILSSDDESNERPNRSSTKRQEQDVIVLDDDDDKEIYLLNDYDQLIGDSYFVPFVVDDEIEMHEAEILKVNEINEDGDARLLCKFLYPLNQSMKYCSKCSKHKNQNCPFNHGYVVDLSMIKASLKSTNLRPNSECIYYEKKEDFWNRGKIVEKKSDDLFIIRSNLNQEILTIKLNNIRPIDYGYQKDEPDYIDLVENDER